MDEWISGFDLPMGNDYWTDLWNAPDTGFDLSGWLPAGAESFWDGGQDTGWSLPNLGGLFSSPITGALLGAGLGSLNGSQQGTTSSTSAPWGPQQPYLQDLFGRAQAASQSSQFPSFDELLSYTQGLGLSSGGAQQIGDTFSGAYMNPSNPLYQSILNDATSQVTGRFYGRDQTGPLGSRSGFSDTFAKTLGNQLSANLFNPERQRQVAYASMFNPATGQAAAQGMRMDPFKSLQNYGSLIGGQYGSVRTDPYFTNPAAGALGGALAGSQIWNNLFN